MVSTLSLSFFVLKFQHFNEFVLQLRANFFTSLPHLAELLPWSIRERRRISYGLPDGAFGQSAIQIAIFFRFGVSLLKLSPFVYSFRMSCVGLLDLFKAKIALVSLDSSVWASVKFSYAILDFSYFAWPVVPKPTVVNQEEGEEQEVPQISFSLPFGAVCEPVK